MWRSDKGRRGSHLGILFNLLKSIIFHNFNSFFGATSAAYVTFSAAIWARLVFFGSRAMTRDINVLISQISPLNSRRWKMDLSHKLFPVDLGIGSTSAKKFHKLPLEIASDWWHYSLQEVTENWNQSTHICDPFYGLIMPTGPQCIEQLIICQIFSWLFSDFQSSHVANYLFSF